MLGSKPTYSAAGEMNGRLATSIRSIQTAAQCPRLIRLSLQPPKSDEYNDNSEKVREKTNTQSHCKFRVLGVIGLLVLLLEVEFENGIVHNLSAEYLRVYSPAVDSKIRSIGGEKVISGRRHVGIMSAEPVGNYGVRLLFDDLHKTGIFTWDYFHHLGTNKFPLMRNYMKTLKKHGLSRDPPTRKKQ